MTGKNGKSPEPKEKLMSRQKHPPAGQGYTHSPASRAAEAAADSKQGAGVPWPGSFWRETSGIAASAPRKQLV